MAVVSIVPLLVPQAGAILKAEVYNIPKPEWASDPAAVAAAAAKVAVPEFQPKKGVKIETDPKVGHAQLQRFRSSSCLLADCELISDGLF